MLLTFFVCNQRACFRCHSLTTERHRRARDVVLQQKFKAALAGKRRALLPSVVSWLPCSEKVLPGLTLRGAEGEEDEESEEDEEDDSEAASSQESSASPDTWSLATGVDADESDHDSKSGGAESDDEEGDETLPQAELDSLADSITAGDLEHVTVRQLLIAAATWEHLDNPLGQNLIQLTLIGARLKYQGFGIAHRLMQVLKDPDPKA
jgi:hypothetical protein